ncbi:hypothetical protein BC628DRAFT_1344570 [Trametes gibbosa]|nr:hypothetical protein BC628DRAFT_1344570 [Trametes gibbosa]
MNIFADGRTGCVWSCMGRRARWGRSARGQILVVGGGAMRICAASGGRSGSGMAMTGCLNAARRSVLTSRSRPAPSPPSPRESESESEQKPALRTPADPSVPGCHTFPFGPRVAAICPRSPPAAQQPRTHNRRPQASSLKPQASGLTASSATRPPCASTTAPALPGHGSPHDAHHAPVRGLTDMSRAPDLHNLGCFTTLHHRAPDGHDRRPTTAACPELDAPRQPLAEEARSKCPVASLFAFASPMAALRSPVLCSRSCRGSPPSLRRAKHRDPAILAR